MPSFALAQIPDFINYQSRLRDTSGVPVTGTTTIQFAIYNSATAGTATDTPSATGPLLWSETYDQATGDCSYIDPDDDGYLTVRLGACVNFPSYLDFGTDDLHLGVTIEGDAEVSPRARMGSTPFAYTAEKVRGAGQSAIGTSSVTEGAALTVAATSTTGIAAVFQGLAGQVADILQVIGSAGERFLTVAANGWFGVGTSTPSAQLTVDGNTDLYGDVFVRGTTTFDGDVIPGVDDVYSLGTPERRWKDLYVGPGTIYVGDVDAFGALGYSISDEYILFDPDGDTLHDIVFDNQGQIGLGTTTPTSKLTIDSGAVATGSVVQITDLTKLTTGSALHIDSNSTSTAVRNLLEIFNTSPLAINTTGLLVDNPFGIAASFLGDVGIGTAGGGNALTVEGGVTISSSTPHTASSSLYNLEGDLYWSGRTVDTAFEQVTATDFQDTDPDSSTAVTFFVLPALSTSSDEYTDITFNPDYTSLYVTNVTTSEILQFDTSGPFSLALAGSTSTLPLPGSLEGVALTNNDTSLYVFDESDASIHQYNLTVPGDITTATYVNASSSIVTAGGLINIDLSADGRELLVIADTGEIYHFRMTTPNDITTLVRVGDLDLGAPDMDTVDIAWSPVSGNHFYVLNADDDSILEYELDNPYDLTGATLVNSGVDLNGPTVVAFDFHSNGNALYVLADTREVYIYTVDQYFENTLSDTAVDLVYLDTDGANQLALGTSTARNLMTIEGGIYLASTTPMNTEEALYNLGGDLYWDGFEIAKATTTFTELTITGSTTLQKLLVLGDSVFNQNLAVYGTTTLATTTISYLNVLGSTTLDSLVVTGDSLLATTAITDLTVIGSTTLATTTIEGALLTNLATGSVTFIGEDGLLTEDNDNFFYDASTTRLGIGTSTPSTTLTVVGTTTLDGKLAVSDDTNLFGRLYAWAESFFTDRVTFEDSLTIATSTPSATSSSIYNQDGDLYWSGRTVDTAFEEVDDFETFFTDPDISTVVDTGVVANLPGSDIAIDLAISSSGTRAYLFDVVDAEVVEYTMSTPYDFDTATITGTTSATAQGDYIEVTSNSEYIYLLRSSTGVISQHTLAIPGDISTASLTGTTSIDAFSSSTISLSLSPDGTQLITINNDELLSQFELSIPYDITSLTHATSVDLTDGSLVATNIRWSPTSGNRFYVLSGSQRTIHEYHLAEAYDISTTSLTQSPVVFSQVGKLSLEFNADGTELYTFELADRTVETYDVTLDSFDEAIPGTTGLVYLNPASSTGYFAVGTSTAQNLVTIQGGVYLASTTPINTDYALYNLGGELYWNGEEIGRSTTTFTELTVTGTTTLFDLFVNNDVVFGQDLTVYGTTTLATTTVANLTVNDFFTVTGTTTLFGDLVTNLTEGSVPFIGPNGLLTEDTINLFYQASTSQLVVGSSSPLARLTVEGGLSLATGTPLATSSTLYALGEDLYWNGVTVDTAFEQVAAFAVGEIDLSTASQYFSLPLNASSTEPQGIAFSDDGTKLFVVGTEFGLIRQYDLLLPYQITNVIGGGVLDVSSTTPNPLDIEFNADGSKLYVLDDLNASTSSGIIYEFDLTENFDLSGTTTLSATSSEVFPGDDIVSMEFNDDGSELFLLGNSTERVYSYTLMTPYDVTGLSLSANELDLDSYSIDEPFGMTFINNGNRLLISADASLNTIYQFDLPLPYVLTGAILSPSNYGFGASETQPRDIAASPSGDTLVVVGATNLALFQLSVTGENGDQLAGSIDLVYLNPALGAGHLALGTSTGPNLLTVDGGVYLGNTAPANVISALYNVEDTLYWNGSQLLTAQYNSDDDEYIIPVPIPIVIPTSATFNRNVKHKKNVTHEGDTIHEKNTRQYYGNFEPGSIVFMEDECFGIGSTSICTGVPYLSEDNDFLYYDWENRRVGIGTNNPTQALTVDGTASFLQAPILPYTTIGAVPFIGINNSLRDSVGMYWDDANGYFGVGTEDVDSVLAKIHVDNGSFLATERNPEQVGALEDAITGNCPTCTIANASDVAMYGNYAVVTSRDEDELVMIDVSEVTAPVQVSEINGASPLANPTSVTILNDIAYVTDSENNALYLFDISIPVIGPTLIGSIENVDCSDDHCALVDAESVYVTPNYAYVASPGSNGVAIIDTSNKENPAHVTSLLASTTGQNLDGAYDVVVDNNFLYVVNFTANSLLSFNVSDPTNPTFIGVLADGTGGAALFGAQDIEIVGNHAYIIASTGLLGGTALQIVDITNPATPAHVGNTTVFHDGGCVVACPSDATDIAIVGSYAYITFGIDDALIVVDISDSETPTYVGEAISSSNAKAIEVSGKYAFVAAAAGSQFQIFELAGIEAPAAQFGSLEVDNAIFNEYLTVAGTLNANTIQTALGSLVLDEAQSGGVLFAGPTGAVTQSPDTFFWNDTNGRLGLGTGNPADKLHINDGRALITAGAPVPLGFLDNGTCDGLQGGDGCPLDGASSVHVLGNYAYVSAQDDDGFAIIDISRPSSPTYVNGEFDTVTEFIDGATDIYVQGEYAYVTSQTDSALSMYSVGDPSQILSADSITDADCDAEVGGEGCALSNPEAVIVDGNYAYVLSNGDRGVAVIDVKDSSFPKHIASIFASTSPALLDGAFNMHLRNGHLYIPAGTDGSLTIIDVTVPEFPTWVSNATSTINELDGAFDVEVRGRYAYVVSTVSQSLSIVDVYDTSSTSILGYFSHADCTGTCNLDTPTGIALAGNYAFITTETNPGIAVFDISDPWAPTYVGFYADGTDSLMLSPTDIEIVGNFAYVTDGAEDGLTVFSLAGVYSPSGDISKLAVDDLMIRESLTVQSKLQAETIFAGAGGITSDGNIDVNSSNVNIYDGNVLVTEKAPVVTRVYTDSDCSSDFSGSECTFQNSQDLEVDPDGDVVYVSSFSEDGITKVNVEDPANPYPVAELADDVSIHLNGISGMDVFPIQQEDQFDDSSSGQSADEDVVDEVLIVLSEVEHAVSVVSTDDETDIDSDSDLDEMSVLSDITDAECDAVVSSGCALGGPNALQSFVMVDGYWAIVGSDDDSGVAIMDVSDPKNIKHETSIFASTTNFASQPVPLNDPDAILVKGTHAFVASGDEDAVTVINVSQPRNPVVVDVIEDGVDGAQLDNPLAFEVQGNFMYIASNDANAVEVYDISIPEAAQYVGRLETSTSTPMGPPRSLSVSGDILLVGTDTGVTEVDISNAANPVITGSIVDDGAGGSEGPDTFETTNLASVSDVETDRGKAYAVSLTEEALTIMSMRNVTAPAGIFDNLWVRGDVSLDGRIKTDLLTVDGSMDVNGNLFADNLGVYNNLAVNGKVSIYDGDLIQTVRNYTPQGTYNDTGGGMIGPTDLAVHPDNDMAYVISPSTDLFTQIDIGEPDDPSYVGILTDSQCDVDAGDEGCALDNPSAIDIKDDYVVLAADAADALSVFDVSSTSSEPEFVFNFNDNICDQVHDGCPMNYISDMEVEGEYVFTMNDPDLPADEEGFAVTLLREDGTLRYLDAIEDDGSSYLAGPGGIAINEDIAYVISSEDDGLTVIDVSEPTDIEVISTLKFDSVEIPGLIDVNDIEFIDDTLYVTSGVDDQLAVIDVTDPGEPEYIQTIDQNDVGEEFDGPEQLEVMGDTLMIAMSEGDAVTLFDISDREDPLYVASLEDNESLELEGAWGITTDDDAVYVTGNTDNGLQILELPRFQGLLADVHTIYGVEGHFHRLTVDDRMEVEDLLTYGTVDIYGDVNLSSANFVQELDI
ncbi:MAG: hypothetical protein AAGA35_03635, partial [Patescibacteria group bacterium]